GHHRAGGREGRGAQAVTPPRHKPAIDAERPAPCGPWAFHTGPMDGQDGIDRWLAMPGARRLVPADADYPSQLAAVGGRPPDLYVLGDVALLSRPQVAIVGSRNPTAAGRRVAAEMARGLVAAGFVITSGLARGIDAA